MSIRVNSVFLVNENNRQVMHCMIIVLLFLRFKEIFIGVLKIAITINFFDV